MNTMIDDDNGQSKASPYNRGKDIKPVLTECWGCSEKFEKLNSPMAWRGQMLSYPRFCDNCLADFKDGLNEAFKPEREIPITEALNTYEMTIKNEQVADYPGWVKVVSDALASGDESKLENYPAYAMAVYNAKRVKKVISFSDEITNPMQKEAMYSVDTTEPVTLSVFIGANSDNGELTIAASELEAIKALQVGESTLAGMGCEVKRVA